MLNKLFYLIEPVHNYD